MYLLLEKREDKHKIIELSAEVSPYNVVVRRKSKLKATGDLEYASITLDKEQLKRINDVMQVVGL